MERFRERKREERKGLMVLTAEFRERRRIVKWRFQDGDGAGMVLFLPTVLWRRGHPLFKER